MTCLLYLSIFAFVKCMCYDIWSSVHGTGYGVEGSVGVVKASILPESFMVYYGIS